MRILLLLPDLFDATGGIQTFNRALVKAISEIASDRNWKITILVLHDKGNSNLVNSYLNSTCESYKGFSGNKTNFTISALFKSMKADVIFFGHVNFVPLALLMNSKLIRYLIVHGVDVWKPLPVFKSWGISLMSKIISVSQYTLDEMMKHNKLSIEKFIILPNTLDPLFNGVIDKNEKIDLPNGKMILTVSRLSASDAYKNIDLVIKSLPVILKEVPDAFYVIVGDGTDYKRLEKLANDLDISNKVIFTGQLTDDLLVAYYKACDVFVLPSLGEGFGIVFLEAMYYGKPCIGAKAGGIPEVIDDGKTGFLCEGNSVSEITKYIVQLLQDGGLCQVMGGRGRKKLEKEFLFKSFRERLEKIL